LDEITDKNVNTVKEKETIKMTTSMKLNRMDAFELDHVNGGTLTEVNQLADAFAKKGGTFGRIVAEIHSALSGKSGVAGPLNIALREAVGKGLKEIGISHDLSVGVLGTGFMSDDNKYSYHGKSISHADVLKMIAAA